MWPGCFSAEALEEADIIVFNTCAVREHAEDRVFGNIGRLKSLKEKRPDIILAVGGCMVQQSHIADKLRETFPFVDIIFNFLFRQAAYIHSSQIWMCAFCRNHNIITFSVR